MSVLQNGYVMRLPNGSGKQREKTKMLRNWWLVKHAHGNKGVVVLGSVIIPQELIGKKLKFKVEIVEEE